MTAIRGSAAAITGAASGIGRALALELAGRGCDLALADRDEAGLQAVAAEIAKAHARKVSVHRVDMAEPGQVEDSRGPRSPPIPASTSSSTTPASP
jgi:short-subunit dehydrogenase